MGKKQVILKSKRKKRSLGKIPLLNKRGRRSRYKLKAIQRFPLRLRVGENILKKDLGKDKRSFREMCNAPRNGKSVVPVWGAWA